MINSYGKYFSNHYIHTSIPLLLYGYIGVYSKVTRRVYRGQRTLSWLAGWAPLHAAIFANMGDLLVTNRPKSHSEILFLEQQPLRVTNKSSKWKLKMKSQFIIKQRHKMYFTCLLTHIKTNFI